MFVTTTLTSSTPSALVCVAFDPLIVDNEVAILDTNDEVMVAEDSDAPVLEVDYKSTV